MNFQSLEFKEGQQAWKDGEPVSSNPYRDDAKKFEDWADGWFYEDGNEFDS